MSEITWKNIGAPDFSGALAAGQRASDQMVKAIDPLKTLITDAQKLDEANFANATKQNQLGLEAQIRNAESIDQLKALTNPETLQNKFGVMFDPSKTEVLKKEQQGILRNQATDSILANMPIPDTNAQAAEWSQINNNEQIDVDRLRNSLVDRMKGVQADTQNIRSNTEYERATKDYLQKQEKIAEDKFIKEQTNNYMKGRVLNIPAAELKKSIIAAAGPNDDVFKLTTILNQAEDAEFKLNAEQTEKMQDVDRQTILGRNTEIIKHDNIVAGATKAYQTLKNQTITPATEEAAKKYSSPLDVFREKIPDGKVFDRDLAGIETHVAKLGLDKNGKPIPGVTTADLVEISLQAFSDIGDNTDSRLFGGKSVSQAVLDRMSKLAEHLGDQKIALSNVAIAEANKVKGLQTYELRAEERRVQYRDSLRSGKPILTDAQKILGGVDISSYATDPNHEKNVERIYTNLPIVNTSEKIDAYIQSSAKGSPITGQMVIDAANKTGTDPKLILAIMQQDSSFGTQGKGKRTNNPGNVNNDDTGKEVTYGTWNDGVDAVASWLAKNRVEGNKIDTPIDIKKDAATIIGNATRTVHQPFIPTDNSGTPGVSSKSELSKAAQVRSTLDERLTQKGGRIIDTRGVKELGSNLVAGGKIVGSIGYVITKPIRELATMVHTAQQKQTALTYLEQSYLQGRVSKKEFDARYTAISKEN